MAHIDICTLQITGRNGHIRFDKMPKKDQRWIADALMDMFTVDDAYYDDESGNIKIQNNHATIDVEILRRDLYTLFEDNEYNVLIR